MAATCPADGGAPIGASSLFDRSAAAWSNAELALEGGDEGTGTVVTRVEGRRGHADAPAELPHRPDEPRLLPPGFEGEARFTGEKPLQGPEAGAGGHGQGRKV